jgi:hypothetical protein
MGREIRTYGREQYRPQSQGWITLFTLLACLLCWIGNYYFSADAPLLRPHPCHTSFLWAAIVRLLSGKAEASIVGAVLLCLAAMLLQRANYMLAILQKSVPFPFLFFLLLNSLNMDAYPLHPASIAFFFLILAVFEIFRAYQETIETSRAFNAMFYLGVGSLVWIYLLWFIPFFWLGMLRFRQLSARHFVASILGMATVYWILLGWCIWKDDFSIWSVLFSPMTNFQILTSGQLLQLRNVQPCITVVLMIITIVYIRTRGYGFSQHFRRVLSFLQSFAFYCLLMLCFYVPDAAGFLYFFYAAASFVFASLFFYEKKIITPLLYYTILVFFTTLLFVQLGM